MIVSVTPSRHEFLLALWNFPCLCCWRLISVLLRTLFFEFFFSFFFDRTLAANASLCQCTGALSPLKSELKTTHVDDWCAAQTDSHNACDISSAPLSSDGLERRIWQGRHLDPGGGFTRKHDQRVWSANSLASWTNKDRHASCAITFSPHRRCSPWKKVWSPTCPLNGSFQSSNCPLKGMFHSPNGIF